MKGKALLFSALLGLLVLFGSCDNDITSTELVVDETKTAVLKLYVKAELDADSENEENVPDGTELIISVKKNDLNGNFKGDDRWVSTVITSGGVVEVNVPATADGVTVYVDAVAFEKSYEVNSSVTELRVYEYNGSFEGIITGTNNVYRIDMVPEVLETITN
jgi:hypothetical protein